MMKAISRRLESGGSFITYSEVGEYGFWLGYPGREEGSTYDCG